MTIGVIEVCVAPAPGHEGGRFGEDDAGGFEFFAEAGERADFEIEADAAGLGGVAGCGEVEGDGGIGTGDAEAGVDGAAGVEILFE